MQDAREEAEEARAAAERQVAEVRAAAERQAAVARAEAEKKAAEAKAEADRKAEEDRKKLEEERQKLEEERKKMEEARLEDERRRKEEMEQFKREMLEMKNAQTAPDPSKDENMAKIMEELRALKEAQANAGSNTSTTTYNYMQDDSNKEELSEFEKRMEELIRSQQKKEEPKPKREPTAFEKRMAELAARKAAAAANGETAAPKPTVQIGQKPAEPAQDDEPLRYNCDAADKFIATLTHKETNEFCDVFVADKLGVLSYMPKYVIGGDNKSFFNKLFIFVGKFRSQISKSLLDKLFKYMRSPH